MTKDPGTAYPWRRSIWLIASAALVPLVLFVIFQAGFAAQEKRRTTEAQARAKAEQLIAAADGEFGRIATILQVLATANATKTDNWPRLAARFDELAAFNTDMRGLSVRRPDELMLETGAQPKRLTRIADGRNAMRPVFVGYARGDGCLCLMFELATTDAVGKPLLFTLLTDSTLFLRLLPHTGESYEVSAFNGPRGRFIARSLDNERRFGSLGSTYLRQAVFSGRKGGLYRGLTLEGFKNYTAFARSNRTGWTAHVALSSTYIDAPARQFMASLTVAGLLSLVLAGLLIGFAVRQLNAARRVNERLQQAQKLEALGQLTGGIAHDFNNLLTPIVGALDQLRRRETLDERGRRLAAGALASAERAAKLTGQLLTFSRRQHLQIGPVDVHPLANDLAGLVERAFGNDHHFDVVVDPRVEGVSSDANQLELALLNLAINGRDASPPGSTITLSIAPADGTAAVGPPDVLFRMVDQGVGMDAETRRRALEPFFTTKPVGRGTGLGLAQVLGVVEQSGGKIDIDSTPGAGTTISIRLPGCAVPHAQVANGALAEGATEQTPLRLLVVDDEPAVRATITGLLEAAGHAVDSVTHGGTALAALAEEPFDLVIVDFAMPGMNGAEVLRRARAIRHDVKALVISGFSDTEALAASGVDAPILAKPFSADQLLDAVSRVAHGRHRT
ncbi:response regulator [Sphingobium subterraneum]|uniref:histidine kinase n=1 Tax=Sphingobium subterraneum TaxID=627688 RepID=A0A841J2H2_9SPHN|nr:response regulator [Sphingobium subterraneum]MBB6123726.1 signal transduction histidine kinase/ActR/RegA family two-component response regulator [Sphingobium subterraneum]